MYIHICQLWYILLKFIFKSFFLITAPNPLETVLHERIAVDEFVCIVLVEEGVFGEFGGEEPAKLC